MFDPIRRPRDRCPHLCLRYKLSGAVNRQALLRSLDRIVARHDTLRSTFHLADGVVTQRFTRDDVGFALREEDLSELSEWGGLNGPDDAGLQLQALIEEEASAPFDLEFGPLIRGRLVELRRDEHVLLVTLHHLVCGDWSERALLRELGTLYGEGLDRQYEPLRAQALRLDASAPVPSAAAVSAGAFQTA